MKPEPIHCLETPRFMTPEAIADMQRLFRNYWRIEWRPNPRNKNINTCFLVRGPACPFYVGKPRKYP